MRDDELRHRLVEANPWWRAAAGGSDPASWAADDVTLRRRNASDLGYRSTALADIADGPLDDRLVVLRGPRRVGKSVLLKDTAASLCRRPDIDPRQVIYLAADSLRSQDLTRVAKLGRELTRSAGDLRRVWLLDEVTSVAGWTSALKYLRDNSAFGDDTVVCTGSSWDHTADVERDLLAGRAGRHATRRLRLLLPMTFREVVQVTRPELWLPEPVAPWELQDAAADAAVANAPLFADDLDLAWQSYLTSGGFPRAVYEHERDGRVSDAFVDDLLAWLHREVDPNVPAESIARLLDGLVERSTSPLSRASAAEALGYSNRDTFDRRINRLVTNFAALWCQQVDDRGRAIPKAFAKLYLTDPLLAWLPSRTRAGMASPDFSHLSEATIGVAVARAVEERQPGRWLAQDTIGYLRTQSGKEIDFAPVPLPTAAGESMTTPIESKWVSHGWRSEALVMENRLHRGVMATRNVVDTTHDVWALPAPVVAALLG
jgi:uncharacterized protein